MLLHTFLLVFIAEMADKTQLMTMALTNRYPVRFVVMGMIGGVMMISGLSVLAGDMIGDFIPMKVIKVAAAIMFLWFGLSNLRIDKETDGKSVNLHFPVLSIALTFMLAELGDKTQLATVALAAHAMEDHMSIFLGASLGLILANIVGIFAGKFIFSHFHEDSVKVVSSFFFFLFGSINLFEILPYQPISFGVYSCILITIAYVVFMKSRKSA